MVPPPMIVSPVTMLHQRRTRQPFLGCQLLLRVQVPTCRASMTSLPVEVPVLLSV